MLRLSFLTVLLLHAFNTSFINNNKVSVSEISIIEKSFNKNAHTYQLNVTYPELRDRQNEKHYELNKEVQGYWIGAITQFQDKVNTINDKNSFSFFNFNYSVYNEFKRTVSLKFTKRSYHPGMKEAVEHNRTLNFDKYTGRIIQLDDFFKLDVEYQKELIRILNKRYSTCKLSDNVQLKNFCLSQKGLVIILEKHSLADNFCSNEIEIDWQELTGLLNTENLDYILSDKK